LEVVLQSRLRYFLLPVLVIFVDQVTKYWAYTRLRISPDIDVINSFLKLSYVENPGIAFGVFSDTSGALKLWALAAISLIAIGLVVYFALKTPPDKILPAAALMLVLGGIIGNLIDRLWLGAVIDFIELYIEQYHWPTFNIADAAICVGALLLSIDILRDPKGVEEAHSERPKEGATD
jgi:signal peptidase II